MPIEAPTALLADSSDEAVRRARPTHFCPVLQFAVFLTEPTRGRIHRASRWARFVVVASPRPTESGYDYAAESMNRLPQSMRLLAPELSSGPRQPLWRGRIRRAADKGLELVGPVATAYVYYNVTCSEASRSRTVAPLRTFVRRFEISKNYGPSQRLELPWIPPSLRTFPELIIDTTVVQVPPHLGQFQIWLAYDV